MRPINGTRWSRPWPPNWASDCCSCRRTPDLNLIERLWGFAKRQSVPGKYHANFASFRTAIESTLASLPTTHAPKLKTLMTLKFQEFDDVSLLAA